MPGKNIVGTEFDDNIVLTNSQVGYYKNGKLVKDASLQSTQGDDTISTGNGNDVVNGDSGNDLINGGNGNDKLYGGSGSDILNGDDGNDTLWGGTDNDTLNGGAGNDRLRGGFGNDSLDGGEGNDTLRGGNGSDTLLGGAGNDVLIGGGNDDDNGADTESEDDTTFFPEFLSGGAGDDKAYGGGGNDLISGGDGSDKLYGGRGNDSIQGDSGNDYLHGGFGNDTLRGGDGDDRLFGYHSDDISLDEEVDSREARETATDEFGREVLDGGNGNDRLYGGRGSDQLFGGAGSDKLYGGAGNDRLQGDGGADSMRGGEGDDLYVITQVSDSAAASNGAWDANTSDTISGFLSGSDKIDLRSIPNLQWSGNTPSAYGVWTQVNGHTYLYADANGDGVADIAIKLKVKAGFVENDVLLAPNNNPVAHDDTASATEAGVVPGSNAAGNVLTGDASPNGDGLTVTAIRTGAESGTGTAGTLNNALNGQYGTLTLHDNGSYSYAVNNTNPAVNALNGSESLTDSFTYTITNAHGKTDTATLTVTVHGANDRPVIDSLSGVSTAAVNVDENTTTVATIHATDVDHGDVVTYSLNGGADKDLFNIDANTGAVSFKIAPDAESGHGDYEVTVQVSDGHGGVDTQTLIVHVGDVNEFAVSTPVDANAADNIVTENAAVGTVVGITALASDADATTHSVTYSLVDNAGGKFAINAATGVITVAGDIDRETDASLSLTVRATSADGSTADAVFNVGVAEMNEFSASTPLDNDAAANVVNENAAVGTVVGITAHATDADATNNTITYSLTNDAGGKFAIDATTGVVTVAGDIDREAAANLSITIRATSADGSFHNANFSIDVNDVNEFAVTTPTDDDAAANTILDNVVAGTAVGITALASDADATTNGVTYSLTNDAGGKFVIDAATGIVTTTGAPLTEGNLSVTIRATSADGSTADANFGIVVNPSNAFTPTFTSGTVASIAENSLADTVVYDANATDADGNALTYSLTGDDAALFSIDANTGEVRFLASPDFETPLDTGADNLYNVVVHANDGVHDTTRAVGISVTDVVEVLPNLAAPVFTSGNTASESENTAAANVVYDANATDADGDILTYSLTGDDAALFSIDAASGQVRFLASPDFETPLDVGANNIYDIVVHANDGLHDSTLAVGITVTNIPETGDADPNDFDDAGNGLAQNTTATAGADTIVGSNSAQNINANDGADLIYGRDGNDSFNGSLGNDTIYGQRGNDNLSGANQDDVIYGGSGDDNISGGAGNDVIYGGSGSDTINGGSGNDTMIGGYGADFLTDGSGTDRFTYLSLFDGGDTITGVTSTTSFDFTAIDAVTGGADNAFTFIAAQNANVVANSITWSQDGTNTYLRADVNGDTVADFELTLTGNINLTGGMFLL